MNTCDECNNEVEYKSAVYTVDGNIHCYRCIDGSDIYWAHSSLWRTPVQGHNLIGSPRRFGVELETQSSPNHKTWAKYDGWGAKSDGSIRGIEFVSPPMSGNGGYDSITEFCKRLEDNNSEHDSNCGYHVHLDLTDSTAEQRKSMALAYHYTREFWYSLLPEGRMDNHHLEFSNWTVSELLENDDCPYEEDNRYIWCNWNAFEHHETVEIRSHHSTINAKDVLSWIRAHTIFMDYVQGMSCDEITENFANKDTEMFEDIWPSDLFRHYMNVRREFA